MVIDNSLVMQNLSMADIRQEHPSQWVLIGNPILSETEINGLIIDKLISGVVLFASKDKREIAYRAKELRKNVESTVCIFTGEVEKLPYFL